MGFGFRVGVPGMSVRVSTRGVRTSVGPRAARISVGCGGTRVSSGLGPFYASSSLRGAGSRRGTSTRRTASRPRAVAPSAAQLDRERRQADRAQQDAQRDAAIAQLTELRRQMTSVHLQSFPMARQPVVLGPPPLGLPWAQAEAQAFHLQQVGRFARAERSAAKSRAAVEAPSFLSAEQARLHAAHASLCAEAEHWWQALVANDEETVCEAVNTAFSDDPVCMAPDRRRVQTAVIGHAESEDPVVLPREATELDSFRERHSGQSYWSGGVAGRLRTPTHHQALHRPLLFPVKFCVLNCRLPVPLAQGPAPPSCPRSR